MNSKSLAFAGLFFYALCWLANAQSNTIWYIGVAMPWLTLIMSIPIAFLFKVKDDNYSSAWGYVYVIATIVYVAVVSLMSGSIWHQMPHLATCVSFIAYFALESSEKGKKELKKKLHNVSLSSEKALEELMRFDDLYPKTIKLNQILIDILNESEEKEESNSK